MTKRLVVLVLGAAVGLLLSISCGGARCAPGNCSGCCDINGACQPGNSASACGLSGAACAACQGTQFCSSGFCSGGFNNNPGGGGGGGGAGDGGLDGGNDGGFDGGQDAGGGGGNDAGSGWSPMVPMSSTALYAVWGLAANDAFAVGSSGATGRYDGTRFVAQNSGPGTLAGVWGSALTNLWAVGIAGNLCSWNTSNATIGPYWECTQPNGNVFNDVHGTGPTNMWLVSSGGIVMRNQGTGWTFLNPIFGLNWLGVVTFSQADTFIVGEGGTIGRWTGQWNALTSPTTQTLEAVWGVSANEVWAVGGGGTIVRCAANACATVPSGTSARLLDVHGFNAQNVWAVGEGGVIVKWNGSTWTPEPSGTTSTLYSVWASSATTALAVGVGGITLRRQ